MRVLEHKRAHFNLLQVRGSSQEAIWSYGAQVSQPVFTGGALRGNLRLAESQYQQALIGYRQSIQRAFGDVSDALIGYQKFHEVRVRQEDSVKDLQESVRLSTCVIRVARPLISKSWMANARYLPLSLHSHRRTAPNTKVSCNSIEHSAEAGSNNL